VLTTTDTAIGEEFSNAIGHSYADRRLGALVLDEVHKILASVTNFIWPYLHQFFIDSHGLNGYGKPLKRPFDRYQSRLEEINNGRDIRQINW